MRARLIELRENRKLTQEEMAELLGISRSFYGHIETATRNPTFGLAKKIAMIFGVPVEEIFFDLEGFRMKQRSGPNNTPLTMLAAGGE